MQVPNQLVSRVYVQNSLRNSSAGLMMSFRNLVSGGSISGFSLSRLEIDGQKYAPAQVQFMINGAAASAAALGQAPVTVPFGAVVEIVLPGVSLPPGEHVVTFGAVIREADEVVATVKDTLG